MAELLRHGAQRCCAPARAFVECYNRVSRQGLSPLLRARAKGQWTHFRELQRFPCPAIQNGQQSSTRRALDAKRGKIFTTLIKEITIAAKAGGGDPDGNPRLRTAIAAAKAENMPNDNIKRAIQRGTGELEGAQLRRDHVRGLRARAASRCMVEVTTDNRNRAVSEVRHCFSKNGGNLGESIRFASCFRRRASDRDFEERGERRAADEHRARERRRRPDRRRRHVGDYHRAGGV